MPELTREDLATWDANDPLAAFRDKFCRGGDHLIYLDGNSLGRPPAATRDLVDDVITGQWAGGLTRSYTGWIGLGRRIGDMLGTRLLGAADGEVVLSDSTSVNLYKLASAALLTARDRHFIVYDPADFPTNRYVAQGLAAAYGLGIREVPALPGADFCSRLGAVLGPDAGLVMLSLVDFRSGEMLPMERVNALAAQAGARIVWDLSHAAGVVPVDLGTSGAELAVGCTYKYLNGGPGAPGFLYVRRDLQAVLRQPIWGWLGQRDQFQLGAAYQPAAGIDRFQVGAPPILSMAAVEPGVALCAEAGIEAIRAKSVRLCEVLIGLADRWLAPHGLCVASPRAAAGRGGHVALRGPRTWQLCQALVSAGVICDFRTPDWLRLAPTPLDTRFVDVWDALERLRAILERGEYVRLPATLTRVT